MAANSAAQVIVLLHQLAALHSTTLLCSGLFFHEYVAHLRYDWSLFRRPEAGRPVVARLAKWAYLACRNLLLVYSVCVTIIAFPGQPDCRALIKLLTATGFLGVVCASTLLSIRVAAIWAWDKRIISLLGVITVVILAFAIFFMAKINSTYDPEIENCTLDGVHSDLLPSVAVLIGDCIILTLLLTGLQKNWREARQFRMWHVLWTQGLLYLLIAAVVEVPLVVLLVMDLNSIMNTMFVTPEVTILAVGATRMFRSLNTIMRGPSGQSEMFTNGVSQGRVHRERDDGVQLIAIRKGEAPRERL